MKMRRWLAALAAVFVLGGASFAAPLVLLSDFGTRDGAVCAMKGVAVEVDPKLALFDLTHEIPAFDVWEAGYRLQQAAPYWPRGTVFVAVVDPGVGTARKSLVLETRSGHIFVGPDNGLFTLVAEDLGVRQVRSIDVSRLHRPGSPASTTFHGRDIYAYNGALLASGRLAVADAGPEVADMVRLPYQKPTGADGAVRGNIPTLDLAYGNVWTNIDSTTFAGLGARLGDRLQVEIAQGKRRAWRGVVPLVSTFGDVPRGKPLAYFDSLGRFALAINLGSFARVHGIGYGPGWTITVRPAK